MDVFFEFNEEYNLNVPSVQIENVEIIDLYEDYYENERKPKTLKYFKEPILNAYPLNLNNGYERHIFRNMDAMYGKTLSKVIKWDMEQNSSNVSYNESSTFAVYTHRQAILNIMHSYFHKNANKYFDWNIFVTKFGNNLYMHSEKNCDEVDSEDDVKRSYHYKLVQILFSDSPYNESKTDIPVDENIRLNGIYRCQLGKFKFIYSAEVQGVISDTDITDLNNMDILNQCRFINTKVCLENKRDCNKKFKMYFQNYLANVDATYLAFRSKEGYVHKPIKPTKTSNMCRKQFWNPKIYEQFLYDFLSLIIEKMSHVNCLETTYEFKYSSFDKAVYYKIYEGISEKSFLPAHYRKFMEEKNMTDDENNN